ncbi:type II toxin-antitoxin system VapC family toxin [uncultured Sphingomonas sp.]|uniref:type II toxin-antitoxin system VapC family toxin n=1 Tax=uncultured Sphingomonas sp. TaxID=158754 RepID=UPI0035CAA739
MIALDGSALLAILLDEDDADRCIDALSRERDLIISAASLAEALIVAEAKGVLMPLREMLAGFGPDVIDLTAERARAAAVAYERWGKGYHRAKLNIMDIFAYTLAKEFDCPLLFVGNDFSLTDVRPALEPRD